MAMVGGGNAGIKPRAGSTDPAVCRYAWVKSNRQEHFFHDGSFTPAEKAATMMKLNAVLAAPRTAGH
jgi:hypothetical protein